MDADFDRYYGRDLAETIWCDEWPPSKILARIAGLPEDSAFRRSLAKGHTSLHEVLAQIRDAVVTTAHGYRIDGKPTPYPRPGEPQKDAGLDITDPENAGAIVRFFGRPKN